MSKLNFAYVKSNDSYRVSRYCGRRASGSPLWQVLGFIRIEKEFKFTKDNTAEKDVLDKLIAQARRIIPTAIRKPYSFELTEAKRKASENKALGLIELSEDEKEQIKNKLKEINEAYAQKANVKIKELLNLILYSILNSIFFLSDANEKEQYYRVIEAVVNLRKSLNIH